MKNFLNFKYFFAGMVVLIILFFLLRGCYPKVKEVVVTKYDTTFVKHDSVIYVDREKLVYVKSIKTPIKDIPKKLLPSNNPDTLVRQYADLLLEHSTKHIYLDTLKIDSIGWVAVEDTVQYNQLASRKYTYSIKERQIKETTTITRTNPPKNLFFVGGEAMFNQRTVTGAQIGLLLKNRKDNIIGVSAGYDFPQKSIIYSAKFYTKLHL